MKSTRTLRILTLLGFLLLLAPFYDSCDGKYGFVRVNNDGSPIQRENTFSEDVYDFVINDVAFTGFEIASFTIGGIIDTTFDEFKTECSKFFQNQNWYKELYILISLLFDFIVLISLSIIIISFTKKTKLLHKLALTNSILIVLTLFYIIFLESSFDHIRQIKWGYYAFIITSLLIFYYSKPNKIRT
ncbi:hypothetical protein IVB69_11155 [Flavobacterium sp. J49]|uniref:hypothetical protein n=1 Tax=Flavobacterium sp. J49 TaxID=2718534 RepID=UPI001592E31B|nr:hypothetical protein [Flavobacterium sp. J49]MBF6642039.1 hypothetical protein [Flavobacterium sp. J49]NIC03287.1 hypothetical protein [Flavobacterium sp. J49]